MVRQDSPTLSYVEFVRNVEPRLRHALIGAVGADAARDATADALTYAWEYWDRLSVMDNPAGYLYRVAQTSARRFRRKPVSLPPVAAVDTPWVEPGLPVALAKLSERQRVVVWAIHGLGWTATEVAELLDISVGSVRSHLKRAMDKLRQSLGGEW